MSVEIKVLKKEDISELQRLFEKTPVLKQHDPFVTGSLDEFKWQFFNDNYQSSVYVIAYDAARDELAATLSALYFPMKTPDGEVCQSIKPEDALVNIKALVRHKDHDFLKELLDLIESKSELMNIKFLWGFTYAANSFERLGFSRCFSSKQGTYVIRPVSAYKHLVSLNTSNGVKQKIQIAGLTLMSYLKSIVNTRNYKEIICKEVELNDINEETLLGFLAPDLYSIHLNKDFLNWRIVENSSMLKYSILQFEDHSHKIIACFIYSQKEGRVFFVEQFLFHPDLSVAFKERISRRALQHLKSKGAAIVRAMGFDHNKVNKEELGILNNAGFIFINRGIPFIFKSLDNKVKPENVYLSRLNTQGTY
ncbi:MAG: hypothetical protein BGP01_06505 [Paludibacter sp. 47-17]|nr:MAG: hypothetical protein BGP01_06505 [Paludibacter sp. 47-17]